MAEFVIGGLPRGNYMVRYGGSEKRMAVNESLAVSIPIADGRRVSIEKL